MERSTIREQVFPATHKQRGKFACYKVMERCTNPEFDNEVRKLNLHIVQPFENVEAALLTKAFLILIERHAALRTVFREEESLKQVFLPADDPRLSPEYYDLSAYEHREELCDRLWKAICLQAFNFETGPLFRCGVVQLGPNKTLAFFVINHIVADGYSAQVLRVDFKDALTFLHSKEVSKPEAPKWQPSDVFTWERENFQGEEGARRSHFWRNYLSGYNNFFLLRELGLTDSFITADISYRSLIKQQLETCIPDLQEKELERFYGNYHRGTSFVGSMYRTVVKDELMALLRSKAKNLSVTLFSLMLAGLFLLLRRFTGKTDLIVGYEGNYRSKVHQLNEVISWVGNTCFCRQHLEEFDSVAELITDIQMATIENSEKWLYPFDKVLDENDVSLEAIGALHLNYLNQQQGSIDQVAGDFLFIEGGHPPYFDIDVVIQEHIDGMRMSFGFKKDHFAPDTIRYFFNEYLLIISELAENAGALDQKPASMKTLTTKQSQ